ncbi:MAG: DUF1801 domain-containing protein [Flavobacteriales bacterium]|nr:DUF1801 domain-containing protein [Flavobacteriales bacterium]
MPKYELKTKVTDASVIDFINTLEDERKNEDAFELLDIFAEITGEEPKMWGPSIIGYGTYHYKYASGQEGDFMAAGFSPRKAKHTIYIMSGFDTHPELMAKLGKYKTGKSCLYVNKLTDIDLSVLKELIHASYVWIKNKQWP